MLRSSYKFNWPVARENSGIKIFNDKWIATVDKKYKYVGEYTKSGSPHDRRTEYEPSGRGFLVDASGTAPGFYFGQVET